jgi:hypothetical protein
VRVRTLLRYLIGDRRAILDLAADRRAVWVGLLFVLSAGFAREYDGQDLLREPWHLLVPAGASLVASFLLFLVACGAVFLRKHGRPRFGAAYRSFLTLFWMTAPLAWLYAIPYERFLPPGPATYANLWTLGLVAAWRVGLMVRVVSVLTGRGVGSSLVLVMAFADAVALAAVYVMPKPVISIMGGVRLTESEAAVQGATVFISCLGILSAPVWIVGGLVAFFRGNPTWQVPAAAGAGPSRGVWAAAVVSVAVWLPILPGTQGEQRLRSRVEVAMREGRIAEGLDVLSGHAPSDFPPHWDPPPRIGYPHASPDIVLVLEVMAGRECAPWVRALYVDKFRRFLGDYPFSFLGTYRTRGEELARVVRVLRWLPEGPDIAADLTRGSESAVRDPSLPAEYREQLDALLELAAKSDRLSKP